MNTRFPFTSALAVSTPTIARGLGLGLIVSAALLSGCTGMGTTASDPKPAVALQDYIRQGSEAATSGGHDKAREVYKSAAKAYPASKEPWQRLAGDYFEAGDYGNAIIAAQEVLLREAGDSYATSVLAVSGLRVSASALQALRAKNSIVASTRSEAETMAKTLRDVLGEPVLLPRPHVAAPTPPRKPAEPAAPPASQNPFDKLK